MLPLAGLGLALVLGSLASSVAAPLVQQRAINKTNKQQARLMERRLRETNDFENRAGRTFDRATEAFEPERSQRVADAAERRRVRLAESALRPTLSNTQPLAPERDGGIVGAAYARALRGGIDRGMDEARRLAAGARFADLLAAQNIALNRAQQRINMYGDFAQGALPGFEQRIGLMQPNLSFAEILSSLGQLGTLGAAYGLGR